MLPETPVPPRASPSLRPWSHEARIRGKRRRRKNQKWRRWSRRARLKKAGARRRRTREADERRVLDIEKRVEEATQALGRDEATPPPLPGRRSFWQLWGPTRPQIYQQRSGWSHVFYVFGDHRGLTSITGQRPPRAVVEQGAGRERCLASALETTPLFARCSATRVGVRAPPIHARTDDDVY